MEMLAFYVQLDVEFDGFIGVAMYAPVPLKSWIPLFPIHQSNNSTTRPNPILVSIT